MPTIWLLVEQGPLQRGTVNKISIF